MNRNQLTEIELNCSGVVSDTNGNLWLFDKIRQAIFKINNQMDEVEYVRAAKTDGISKFVNNLELYYFNEVIYIPGFNAEVVLSYSIAESKFDLLENKADIDEAYNVVEFNNNIYFIPRNICNTTYAFEMGKDVFYKVKPDFDLKDLKSYYSAFLTKFDSSVLLPQYKESKALELSIDQNSLSYRLIEFDKQIKMICANKINGVYYLSEENRSGMTVIKDDGTVEYLGDNTEAELGEMYCSIISVDNYIVMLPRFSDKLYICDENGNFKIINLPFEKIEPEKVSLCHGYYYKEKILTLFPWGSSQFVRVNLEMAATEIYNVKIDSFSELLMKIESNPKLKETLQCETDEFSVADFVYAVTNDYLN